tara:strand:+ start:13144 stop:14754 length:1611 start_codon:yes stop_codon:yes gene_type:complete
MANFKRMTRGLKLLIEHIYTPISTILTLLTGTGVTSDDYDKKYGTFRVNINIPYVNYFSKLDDSDRYSTITMPFVLPAFQEVFELDNSEINDYELVEVSVGQDTRAEAAWLHGVQTSAAGLPESTLVPGEGNAFTVYLMEKELETTGEGSQAQKEIYRLNLPEVALLDPLSRANPYVQTGISTTIRHDRSYLIEFVPTKNLQPFYSMNISFKLKHKLTSRDLNNAAQTDVQNMPAHLGAFNNVVQSPTLPASNAAIVADGATGVSTNFSLIDNLIARGLRGGYKKSGRRRYAENLKSDAGYEVIAVPMFGSWFVPANPALLADNKDALMSPLNLPWHPGTATNLATMDRAIIPLQYPMTIHHVLIAVSYADSARTLSAARPTQITFTNEVGVGLLQGIRSEDLAIQQVAHLTWTPTGGATPIGTNKIIDRMSSGPAGAAFTYMWDVLQCPLVGTGGTGYYAQGNPVFAAKGDSPGIGSGTNVRSNINGAPPVTGGGEQALDIRWKISDTGAYISTGGNLIGWPGHWVYIIGKKHLI